ncbi:MAG: MmcQ/YjbR family DNA-binding protein [Muribaculaceae bacterium]|nr:MmcQ/YjbR family DNA-binding protein [Muribaculaceae bacterium]
MDIETVREYCLSLPLTTEDMAFGEGNLLFRVCNKIFACLSIDGTDYLALKCDPEYAIELREIYTDVEPAYHWNKKYWNQVSPSRMSDKELLMSLIRHSYAQVASKLPKKIRSQYPEICEIR